MSTPAMAAPGAASHPSARRRGSLVLADKVVEKIASQAATEVTSVSGRSGGFLGIGTESDPAARPKVDATLSEESTDLDVSVGIAYPGSIREATGRLREHLTRRVEELTGLAVRRVDIDVTLLPLQEGTPRKALR